VSVYKILCCDADDCPSVSLPELRVVKVDCVENNKLCQDQQIHAFPTIRFFKDGKPSEHGDYKKDRSLTALLEYSKAEVSPVPVPPTHNLHFLSGIYFPLAYSCAIDGGRYCHAQIIQ
jgi:hypothetical protein